MSGQHASIDDSPLAEIARMLNRRWRNIERARQMSQEKLQQLSKIIENVPTANLASGISVPGPDADASIVVHGSLARFECTKGSDLDWTLLVDGVANPAAQKTFLAIKNALYDGQIFRILGVKPPGQEGTFGALNFSQPMMHYIGGEEDSNSNTTRRVLLLLEALPLGKNRQAFDNVRAGILWRYIDEDRNLLRKDMNGKIRWIPLFLLNDFARYWRTMAVDFAYKQYDRGNRGYALRITKLGVSRKLLFASGLLTCFWCDPAISGNQIADVSKQNLIIQLVQFLSLTPLERIAFYFTTQIRMADSDITRKEAAKALRDNARELFDAYDQFLTLLNSKKKRQELDQLQPDSEEGSSTFLNAHHLRSRFRSAIEQMFTGDISPLREHSIGKGIF